jgi:hypothetical protein
MTAMAPSLAAYPNPRWSLYTAVPKLFGVGFEKSQIQLTAKAINEELFQIALVADRKEQGVQITQRDADGAQQTQFPQ